MIEIPGKIPILIHPLFWLLAFFIGFVFSQGNLVLTIPWMVIVCVSVLIHEYGHAVTALLFGKKPRISLVALGGVTTYEATSLSLKKQFLIILNGPIFGFLLALCALLLLQIPFKQKMVLYFLSATLWINLFWSIMNLLPIFPLDGGQLLKVVLEGLFHAKGVKLSFLLSSSFALILSLFSFFFLQGGLFLGLVLIIFSFQSFEIWRRSRLLSDKDQQSITKEALFQGERALRENHKDKAEEIFKQVREETKEGMLFTAATQYLSLLYIEQGKKREAYDLLLTVKQLSDEATLLLYDLAFQFENYTLVAELSSRAYELTPCKKIALQNVQAFAHLHQGQAAGGWLTTASEYGPVDLSLLLKDSAFAKISQDPEFKKFFPPK